MEYAGLARCPAAAPAPAARPLPQAPARVHNPSPHTRACCIGAMWPIQSKASTCEDIDPTLGKKTKKTPVLTCKTRHNPANTPILVSAQVRCCITMQMNLRYNPHGLIRTTDMYGKLAGGCTCTSSSSTPSGSSTEYKTSKCLGSELTLGNEPKRY
jgi:hypothetical protein